MKRMKRIFRMAIKFHQHWYGKCLNQDFQDFQDFQDEKDEKDFQDGYKISPTLVWQMSESGFSGFSGFSG